MSDALTMPARLARTKFRSWHRGTREADYIFGGYFDRYSADWTEHELAWFEALLDQEDVDVIGWAMGTIAVPQDFAGSQMDLMKQLDYVDIPR
ncbi:MAG: succinate dehydrogenase assembly factor 2 [Erythrobacter sp.]